MADLLIKEAEVAHLDQLIGSIPTTYGFKIISYLNYVAQLRQQEAQEEAKAPTQGDVKIPTTKKTVGQGTPLQKA